MQPKANRPIFYKVVANSMVAMVTNMFVWFALTFWAFLLTESVLVTSFIGGSFAVVNMFGAIIFGSVVDNMRKKSVMLISSFLSFICYAIAGLLFVKTDLAAFSSITSISLWCLVFILLLGTVFGNLRTIALSTTVSLLFTGGKDKANGLVGMVNGLGFSVTSILSGLVIGFYGMGTAIVVALVLTFLAFVHLLFIQLDEPKIVHASDETGPKKKFDLRKTIAIVAGIPGLFALIFFTTFNNFIGGIFMALMDAYGLSLVSVQIWGTTFAIVSFGFIAGSAYVTTKGLGDNPIRSLLFVNIIAWTTCIFFVIQPWFWLLFVGMVIWMAISPVAEAAEQTIIQSVVPYERQGRVFGFAQSIESAASPVTAFMIGPIAQFVFIPFMTTGSGVGLIGDWFGTGADRGIALIFILAGVAGLIITLLAFRSKSYRTLVASYTERATKTETAPTVS